MDALINLYQGIMLILLFLTLTIRSIFLYLKNGIFPFVIGKDKKGFNAVIEILFLIGLLIWSYEIITIIFNIEFHIIPIDFVNKIILNNIILKYLGMGLIFIGYILFLMSLVSFGKSWRVGIDSKNPGKLVTNGIFSITRNPIFVYIDLYFVGTALINTNILFILFAVLVIIGIHYQILQEEIFLSNFYGQEYSEYKKRVRRYI